MVLGRANLAEPPQTGQPSTSDRIVGANIFRMSRAEGKEELIRQLRALGSSDKEIASALSISEEAIGSVTGVAAELDEPGMNVLFQRLESTQRERAADFAIELQTAQEARGLIAGAAVNVGLGLEQSLSEAQR